MTSMALPDHGSCQTRESQTTEVQPVELKLSTSAKTLQKNLMLGLILLLSGENL